MGARISRSSGSGRRDGKETLCCRRHEEEEEGECTTAKPAIARECLPSRRRRESPNGRGRVYVCPRVPNRDGGLFLPEPPSARITSRCITAVGNSTLHFSLLHFFSVPFASARSTREGFCAFSLPSSKPPLLRTLECSPSQYQRGRVPPPPPPLKSTSLLF